MAKHCRDDVNGRWTQSALAKPLMGNTHDGDLFVKLLTKAWS